MRGTIAVFSVLAVVAHLSLSTSATVHANEASLCTNYQVIYARGSGQVITARENEAGYEKEREAIKERLAATLSRPYSFVELGSEQMKALGEYRAIKVNDEEVITGMVATVTQGAIGKYKGSVAEGVELLHAYMVNQTTANPEDCFVLIGYSQGAQVIGDMLHAHSVSPYINKIKYVGLLGDPKHNSTGYLKLGSVPGSILPWYRGDSWVILHDGWLGARVFEYLPRKNDDTLMKAGSWCYKDDPICSGYVFKGFDVHGKYPERAIPQIAIEIASVINNPTNTVTKDLRPPATCGPAKQDIVVLLDTSPLMRRDATVFTDTPMFYGNDPNQRQPTAGEMLARVGCGDTRIAVVGYGRPQDGPPRLLLDFTKDPKAYDELMRSLYQPSATGQYERTQFREAAITALNANWRESAGKVILTITNMAGTGPANSQSWRGWGDSRVSDPYLRDSLTQQLIAMTRERDVPILGVPLNTSYDGFTKAAIESGDIYPRNYLRMIAAATGGYSWVREVPSYWGYNFKYTLLDTTLNHPLKMREQLVGDVNSARAKVGEPLTLRVNDTLSYLAAAKLRGDSTSYTWYVDCDNKAQMLYDIRQEITFTPTKAQKCKARVVVSVKRNTSAGCYWGCPEPFPPYLYRSIAFDIDIKPADYTPKVPAKITSIEKTIYNNKVAYAWQEPSYEGEGDIVYIVRDSDGSVLAATTARQLTITETAGTDPEVAIEASGEDGKSEAVIGTTAATTDLRTPPEEPGDDEGLGGMTDTQPLAVQHASIIAAASSGSLTRVDVGEYDSDEAVLSVLGAEAPMVPLAVEDTPSTAPQSASTTQQGTNVIPWWGILSLVPALIISVFIIRKLEIK